MIEEGDGGVQQDVGEVVAEGRELVRQVVEAEAEHGQRAVALVALLLHHRRAPEVVLEQVGERHVRPQVSAHSKHCDDLDSLLTPLCYT